LMFFEENLNDAIEEESLLNESGAPLQPLSQTSDGGASSGAPSMSRSVNSFPLDGSLLSGVAHTPVSSTTSSAAAAVQLLMEATANERFSPEILPYPASTVNAITGLLRTSQQRLANRIEEEKRENTRSLLPFRPSDIMYLELQRIQFFLCELLRCRLRKINQLCLSLWYEGHAAATSSAASATETSVSRDEEAQSLAGSASTSALPEVRVPQRRNLSPREVVVADRLAESVHRAVLESGLQSIPSPLQHLVPHPPEAEGLEILPEPNLGAYVFGVALEDLGVVNLGEGVQDASRAISAGELFLTPYHNFRPFVMSGQVRLV
jgi:GINS complex subunit 4